MQQQSLLLHHQFQQQLNGQQQPFVGFSNLTSHFVTPEDTTELPDVRRFDISHFGAEGCGHCGSISAAWRNGVAFGASM